MTQKWRNHGIVSRRPLQLGRRIKQNALKMPETAAAAAAVAVLYCTGASSPQHLCCCCCWCLRDVSRPTLLIGVILLGTVHATSSVNNGPGRGNNRHWRPVELACTCATTVTGLMHSSRRMKHARSRDMQRKLLHVENTQSVQTSIILYCVGSHIFRAKITFVELPNLVKISETTSERKWKILLYGVLDLELWPWLPKVDMKFNEDGAYCPKFHENLTSLFFKKS